MPLKGCPSRDNLSAFLLGTLAEHLADEIANHVAFCATCQSELAVLDDGRDILAGRLRAYVKDPYSLEAERDIAVENARAVESNLRNVIYSGDRRLAETTSPRSPVAGETVQFSAGEKVRDYELIEKVGQGQFGTVFRAHDTVLDRDVAIKFPLRSASELPNGQSDIFAEARKVAALKHPYIVAVYNVGEANDRTPFVVMEYVSGGSLRDLLARKNKLPPSEAARLLSQIAQAVHFAHGRGFVHRDLKPSNILVDSNGEPKVVDFGLALHESVQRRHAGELAGTSFYMAPEQVRREAQHIDGRADIWSLGVILYEVLTGRLPFAGESFKTIADEILNREPKPPRQIDDSIPAELERICHKCLTKSVANRYSTAGDLARDLRHWQRPRRRLVVAATFAVAFLFILAMAFPLWHRQPNGQIASEQAIMPIAGTLDVLLWNSADAARRARSVCESGVPPLRIGDQIRIVAKLSRPAYMYIVWIDKDGEVQPLYPWTDYDWANRPVQESPQNQVSLPAVADQGLPVQPPFGTETFLLLARDSPLPPDVDFSGLLTGLPRPPLLNADDVLRFSNGKLEDTAAVSDRGFGTPSKIRDPLLKIQRLIQERLGPHFELNRAIYFLTAE